MFYTEIHTQDPSHPSNDRRRNDGLLDLRRFSDCQSKYAIRVLCLLLQPYIQPSLHYLTLSFPVPSLTSDNQDERSSDRSSDLFPHLQAQRPPRASRSSMV